MVKILGFEMKRAQEHDAGSNGIKTPATGVSVVNSLQKTKPSRPLSRSFPRAEMGDSGTRMLHGIITEEYDPQLQGIQGIKIYDEMRRTDGTVRAAMIATTMPIIRASWFVNPAVQDDEQSKEIASFIEHALFDWLDIDWTDFIRQALLMTLFGVMPFEKVYTTKEHEGKTYVTLEKLAPRLPKSILMWELVDQTFGIQQIRQDGVLAQIPGSKLVIFVNEREGDNWWGTSLYRSAYRHWYYKSVFYRIDAAAFERQGMGIPVITMPKGYTPNDEKKAQNVLQNLRANEQSYVLLPSSDYKFEFANMGAHTTRDPQNSINHHNKQILQSVLAQFLELGQAHSNVGSRALSTDHSDLFLKALESIANTLVSTINKELIPELVDLNFNDVSVYPVLDYDGISRANVADISKAYAELVTAGAITPTDDDQQYLRAQMGLPPRSQDDIDKAENDDPSSEDLLDHADIEDETTDEPVEDPAEKPADGTVEDAASNATAQKKQTPANNKQVDKSSKGAKQKSHEHYFHLKRKFDDGTGFMSWRPLTFAEQKVNFQTIEDNMNKMEGEFTASASKVLTDAKNAFMAKVQKAIENGDTRSIGALEVAFEANYKDLLKNAMKTAYEYGKKSASNEMDIPTPVNSAESLSHIEVIASAIAAKTASDIEAKVKIGMVNAMKQNTPKLQALGNVDANVQTTIGRNIDNAASIVIGQGINNGRGDVFQRNASSIHGLQRSEILDQKTCNFCLSMDGLVVDIDDPWANTDIYHGSCRGIWVEILKDEQNPPPVTGVPSAIGDYYGGEPNSLIQPPKPIVRPGSLAEKIVQQRESSQK